MTAEIIQFCGGKEPAAPAVVATERERQTEQTEFGPERSRAAVQRDIAAHVQARKSYGKAVAWEAAIRATEDAEPYQLEDARCHTAMMYREMQEAARALLICMPTDPKGLIDLLMYLEKNFSVLPLEIFGASGSHESLAKYLLRAMRLSLREIIKPNGRRRP